MNSACLRTHNVGLRLENGMIRQLVRSLPGWPLQRSWHKYRRESLQSGRKQPSKISQLRTQKSAVKLFSKAADPRRKWAKFGAILLLRQHSWVNTVESTLLTRISIFIISDHGEESWQLVPMARCKYFLGWLNDRLHNFLVLENFIDHVFEIKDLIYFLWSQLRVVRRPICSDQVFFWSAALVRSWHNSKKIRIELWVTFMIT